MTIGIDTDKLSQLSVSTTKVAALQTALAQWEGAEVVFLVPREVGDRSYAARMCPEDVKGTLLDAIRAALKQEISDAEAELRGYAGDVIVVPV